MPGIAHIPETMPAAACRDDVRAKGKRDGGCRDTVISLLSHGRPCLLLVTICSLCSSTLHAQQHSTCTAALCMRSSTPHAQQYSADHIHTCTECSVFLHMPEPCQGCRVRGRGCCETVVSLESRGRHVGNKHVRTVQQQQSAWTAALYMHSSTPHAQQHTAWTAAHCMDSSTLHGQQHSTCTAALRMHSSTLHGQQHTAWTAAFHMHSSAPHAQQHTAWTAALYMHRLPQLCIQSVLLCI
jgi:hypothetical protein